MAILANGRPLITTEPSSPIPELIHGENVWLTPIDDTVALKEAISQLAADPDLRIRLGRGAALLSKSFSWDRIAQQTSAFFEAITNLDP
jgi:glycosyltransferase involved in cell wall biosynthesis